MTTIKSKNNNNNLFINKNNMKYINNDSYYCIGKLNNNLNVILFANWEECKQTENCTNFLISLESTNNEHCNITLKISHFYIDSCGILQRRIKILKTSNKDKCRLISRSYGKKLQNIQFGFCFEII